MPPKTGILERLKAAGACPPRHSGLSLRTLLLLAACLKACPDTNLAQLPIMRNDASQSVEERADRLLLSRIVQTGGNTIDGCSQGVLEFRLALLLLLLFAT